MMSLEELIVQFIKAKEDRPENDNELLDFLQQRYVKGALTITEYRFLLRELQARGAQKPDYSNQKAPNFIV